MGVLYNKEKRILFHTSPKSNCTVVAKMFYEYIGLLNTALEYCPWIHNYTRDKYQSRPKKDNVEEILKIKFVRNPFTRAVSSYLHIMNTNLKDELKMNNESFFDFLNIIWNKPLCVGANHFLPQYDEKFPNKYFNEIIKVENINNEIVRINATYAICLNPSHDSHHFKSKHISNENITFAGYSSYDEINKMIENNNLPSYYYFYNDDNIKNLVKEIFAQDILNYNYSFEEILSYPN